MRGFTANREITAMQPHCLAGAAQRRFTWAVTFMGYSSWLTVKLHTKERGCMMHLVSTVFSVLSLMILGKTMHYSCVNLTGDVPSSYASMLMEQFCPFVDFLTEFLACVPVLYLLWSIYQIIASLVKGVKCIHHPSLSTHTHR